MSWIRKMSGADIRAAKALAKERTLEEIRALATERHRKDQLMGGLYIPLSIVVLIIATIWLVAGEPTPIRGTLGLSAWLVPIIVTRIGLEGHRKGRIIALAFHIREVEDEKAAAATAGDDTNTGDT